MTTVKFARAPRYAEWERSQRACSSVSVPLATGQRVEQVMPRSRPTCCVWICRSAIDAGATKSSQFERLSHPSRRDVAALAAGSALRRAHDLPARGLYGREARQKLCLRPESSSAARRHEAMVLNLLQSLSLRHRFRCRCHSRSPEAPARPVAVAERCSAACGRSRNAPAAPRRASSAYCSESPIRASGPAAVEAQRWTKRLNRRRWRRRRACSVSMMSADGAAINTRTGRIARKCATGEIPNADRQLQRRRPMIGSV